ncbi:LytR family transcriptional regulator [Nocardioides sp. GY 10113]|uniref:LCP family protein n=1 Tax=Nocardioides sp. GY 10113 TaxID=2569761 RepID=UPI0010A79DEB|nr:LCP family protein [Nocardioides sp. GY 10113]TIC87889.1 LytR family transcriptional regulator [Nocardioides sp. GY 10113]
MAGNGTRGDGGDEGGSEFDWLYGQQQGGGQPTAPRKTTPRPTTPRPAEERPDPTMLLPQQPRPGGRGAAPGGTPGDTPPPGRPAPTRPPQQPPARTGRSRSGWARPRRWIRLLLALFVLWLVYLVAVPFFAWSKVDKIAFSPDGDRPEDQPGTTYLIVGSDSRGDLTAEERKALGTGGDAGAARTDSILLLHTGAGPDTLISIPRDTLMEIPGRGTSKVNAAFATGGPALLTQTLEQNTGIRIDHYVEIGFAGFVDIVDAVGGVEICPKQAIKDKQANLNVTSGCQEADGPTALGYARSRHASFGDSNDDFARVRRQREVIGAIGSKVASPWTVLNPVRYWRLNLAAPGAIAVGEGMGVIDAGRFALGMASATGDGGTNCTLPVSYQAVSSGYSDVVVDTQRAEQLYDIVIEDRTDDLTKKICNARGL